MPNHFHGLMFLPEKPQKPLDKISGGKRFLAYNIVKNLESENTKGKKGKKHQVFHLSFDANEGSGVKEVEVCLDYIHHNPVSGK
jgi:hypothetical protein